MADLCAPPSSSGLAGRLLADTDCQALGLVERGYAALSAPGGSVGTALTGLMTVAVALFGVRLLLGRGLALGDTVGLAVRLGVVLLLAGSWGMWGTVVYDLLARAPTAVAGDLLRGIGAGEPLAGVQAVLDRIEAASVGFRTRAGIASPLVGGPAATAAVLSMSALLLTVSTVGLLVVARVVLALLLAIAPVMAGLLLFRSTQGMAEGWLRAMVGAALVPLGVLVLAAIELALLGPLLSRLLAAQAAGRFEPGDVTPIGLVTVVFALAMLAAARAGAQIARGIRLPERADAGPATVEARVIERDIQGGGAGVTPAAAQLAQVLQGLARRDEAANAPGSSSRAVVAALTRVSPAGERVLAPTGAAATGYAGPSGSRATMVRAPRRTRAAARRDG